MPQNENAQILPLISLVVSIGSLFVAYFGSRYAIKVAKTALKKSNKEERYELTNLVTKTQEFGPKVTMLDKYIFEKKVFATKREVLDAITEVKAYWKENAAPLEHHLGAENIAYRAMRGLFSMAIENEGNKTSPDGVGEWRGTKENLRGFTVNEIVINALRELERKASAS